MTSRKNDTKCGFGVYVWKDGSVYEGDFVDGLRNGHGIYTYSKYDKYKRDYYDGSWVDGLKSGIILKLWWLFKIFWDLGENMEIFRTPSKLERV
jgi:hypothetical protein